MRKTITTKSRKSRSLTTNQTQRLKKNIHLKSPEVLIVRYCLQLFMWIILNGGFTVLFEKEEQEVLKTWNLPILNLVPDLGIKKSVDKLKKLKKIIMSSLYDAAFTTGLQTIYNSLLKQSDKTALVVLSMIAFVFFKRDMLMKSKLADFLDYVDMVKTKESFSKYVGKNIVEEI